MGTIKRSKRKKPVVKPPVKRIQAEKKYLHRVLFERAVVEGARPSELCQELGVSHDKLERVVRARQKVMLRPSAKRLQEQRRVDSGRMAKEIYKLRLNHLWQEAMNAWRKSLVDQATEKQSQGGESEKTETTRRPQTGDARYLQLAWRLAEEAYRLEGDLPAGKPEEKWKALETEQTTDKRNEGEEEAGHEHELSVEQRRAIASGLLAALRERGGEAGPAGADCRREVLGSAECEVVSASTLA